MTRRFTKILAALALLVGLTIPMGMWGQNYSFPSELPGSWSTSGGTQTISNIPWTYSSSTYIALDNSHTKVQIGSSKNPQTSDWTIQTPIASFGDNATVTEIAITAYTTATTATYDISVGGNSVKSGSLTTTSATYSSGDLSVSSGNIVVTMKGSNTSKAMYLCNISITYTTGDTPTLLDNDLTLNPASLSLDMYANPNTGTINYTTSSTGAVTVSASDYVTTSVNSTAKTITVTPTAVTPSAQTITVNQAADDNYAAGSKTFTVNITNSAPSIVIPAEDLSLSYEANDNGSFSISFTNGFIPNLGISPTFYSDAACQNQLPTSGDDAWIVITETGQNSINYNVTANTSTAARTAYLKVNAASNYTGEIVSISNVFTVTQAAVDYATLPFAWAGGAKSDFEALAGTTTSGLGSDYTGNNFGIYKMKFDGTGDYIQIKTDRQPGTVTIGALLNGSSASTITVQASTDGTTFDDGEVLTVSGSQYSISDLVTTRTFNSDVRYVRLYFTKSGSNVGVGPITIAEYVAPQEHTIEVTSVSNAEIIVFDATNPVDNNWVYLFEGVGNAQVLEGTPIAISVSSNEGYTLASLMVNGINHVADVSDGVYTFNMPSENVTISATAVVRPLEATFIFNTDAGLQALGIVKPASNNGTDLEAGHDYTLDDITMTCTHGSTNTRVWNSGGSTDLRVYGGGSLTFTAPANYVITSITFTGSDKFGDWSGAESSHTFNASGTKKISTITVTFAMAKVILPDQWYLIASPVGTVDIDDVENLTSGTHGLYSFDQTGGNDGKEWRNYKAAGAFSQLEAGTGYLYINQGGCTLTFTGTPYTGTGTFQLVYSTSTNITERFRGLNLVGNPYAQSAAIDRNYYIMNANGTDLAAYTSDDIVPAMQGVFVKATEEGEYVTFTPNQSTTGGKGIEINLSQNRGTIVDRAIVRFGEGSQLSKVQLFENSTKLYIPQNGKDYAIVSTEAQGELPVNFRASENGTYTLSMDVENMDMNYLHLIDNMTGMDIDLLQTPSYTFNATTRDYESRFRLVFAGNNANADSDNFAFFSNGNLIINNEGNATLQVVDLTGRILSSETINGSVSTTINAVPGVYMLRLINGENVNVQKIVVR